MADPDANEPFSMVQEAVSSYEVRSLPDGQIEVRIVIPQRFVNLWRVKLSELRGTVAEVDACTGNESVMAATTAAR